MFSNLWKAIVSNGHFNIIGTKTHNVVVDLVEGFEGLSRIVTSSLSCGVGELTYSYDMVFGCIIIVF
jgi:hypothetical protein